MMLCRSLAFIFWPLNPIVAADGWSYFCFECPCLHVHRMALFLSAVKNYIVWDMGIPSQQ